MHVRMVPAEYEFYGPWRFGEETSLPCFVLVDRAVSHSIVFRIPKVSNSIPMKATEVFTPSSFPKHTYVERTDDDYEQELSNYLAVSGQIVSIAGPSKSGKTVLVEKVVGDVGLITVTGAGLNKPSELWNRILDWMDVPTETGSSTRTGGNIRVGGEAKGSVGPNWLAKAEASGKGEIEGSGSKSSRKTRTRRGMAQVIEEIGDSDFVLLIDDFHYMPRLTQDGVAKQIKEAARQGVSIITASVPHRTDDVVRANPELRGRVLSLDLDYWDDSDLRKIPQKGFDILNIDLDEGVLDMFVCEAAGSPQLMQAICMNTCFAMNVMGDSTNGRKLEPNEDVQNCIFEKTSASLNFRSLVEVIDSGPKTRGTERNQYSFTDGTSGDVYRCILKAISSDPPSLSFSYEELLSRVEEICESESPPGSSVIGSCEHISRLALDKFPKERVIDWDESKHFLDIPDPYLLFYLRWSGHLKEEER